MADDLVLIIARIVDAGAVRQPVSLRRIGAHVRAALLLRHAHADRERALGECGLHHRVVVRARDARHPVFRQGRLVLECGDTGIGHGQRAARALIRLVVQIRQPRPRHVRTGPPSMAPGIARHTVLNAQRHDAVIGRVELHLVQPVPVAVEELRLGLVLVGRAAQLHQLAAGDGAIGEQVRLAPGPAFARDGLAQGHVARIQIEVA